MKEIFLVFNKFNYTGIDITIHIYIYNLFMLGKIDLK